MARLQETMLNETAPEIVGGDPDENSVVAHFGPEIGPACWREFAPKRMSGKRLREVNQCLSEHWESLRERISRCSRAAADLEQALVNAGAPLRPGDLAWTQGFYRDAVRHAREIRNRYTFLDFAAQSDRLDRFVSAL